MTISSVQPPRTETEWTLAESDVRAWTERLWLTKMDRAAIDWDQNGDTQAILRVELMVTDYFECRWCQCGLICTGTIGIPKMAALLQFHHLVTSLHYTRLLLLKNGADTQ